MGDCGDARVASVVADCDDRPLIVMVPGFTPTPGCLDTFLGGMADVAKDGDVSSEDVDVAEDDNEVAIGRESLRAGRLSKLLLLLKLPLKLLLSVALYIPLLFKFIDC